MFINKDVDGIFVLPKEVLKYMNSAKKTELKTIMYLFANGGNIDIQKASEFLGESADNIQSALSFWRGTGIISENDDCAECDENSLQQAMNGACVKSPSEKGYSTIEVADARKNDSDFSHLVDYVEGATGELLNSSKQGDLLYLYDNLGMQCDVIMGIVAHCVSLEKTKIRYIVKTAEGIHNDGVRTYKELESYLAQKNSYKEYSTFVKKLVGAGDRTFTAAEEKNVKKWESEYHADTELVKYAYERTIALISKPSLAYMSKILESWHNDGIDTVEKARAAVEKQAESKKVQIDEKAKKAGFDIDLEDIFEKP